MASFESGKQTQNVLCNRQMKGNAVINEEALPLFRKLMSITSGQADTTFFFLSCSQKSLKPVWIAKAQIVKLTIPFTKDGNKNQAAGSPFKYVPFKAYNISWMHGFIYAASDKLFAEYFYHICMDAKHFTFC